MEGGSKEEGRGEKMDLGNESGLTPPNRDFSIPGGLFELVCQRMDGIPPSVDSSRAWHEHNFFF